MTKQIVKPYMIGVYAVLVREGREIDSLPAAYRLPVAEFLAQREEKGETK